MKNLVATLVAGIILMAWQTASHTALQLHSMQEQYTPAQDTILQVLSQHLTTGGQYYLPNLPPGSSMEDYEKAMEQSMGKPWASIIYYPSNETNMVSNILRGLATNILLAFFLVWILGKLSQPGFSKIVAVSLAVGFIGFCFHPYPGFIWYKIPGVWVELIDSLVAFGLAGIWLGWWLGRKASA